jgi:hypothetical protein
VLGPPDNQALSDKCRAYEELIDSAVVLSIASVRGRFGSKSSGWLLSLNGTWFRAT